MTNCSECGHAMSTKAPACPGCGAKHAKTKWWLLWVPIGAVAAFLAFGALVGNSSDASERGDARRAIDLCWSNQSRKSNDPSMQRFIAGACEQMEADFVRRYGVRP